MCSAVSRRGLPRGLTSRAFSAADLSAAAPAADQPGCVLVDVDAEGYLCAGGGGGGGGAARAAARARLAPHVHACNAVLSHAPAAAAPRGADAVALRLRLTRAVAPLHELLLWFDEDLLAAVDMSFLTLRNIRGRREYECHECGARFEEPNPLKVHLFLRCAPHAPQRFWRRLAARLGGAEQAPRAAATAPPPEPALTAPAHTSAFRLVSPPAAAWGGTSEAEAAAARLEALAAAWGRRGAGGHACVYCGKLYSRKYGLKIHLRTHTGYRPLRCATCARAFGDPSNLNKHVRLHAARGVGARGGAPHTCPRCAKPLARRRDLERHMRAHCTASPPAPSPRDIHVAAPLAHSPRQTHGATPTAPSPRHTNAAPPP